MLISEASLMKAAIDTGIAAFAKDGGSKANKQFRKLLTSLADGGTPEPAKKKTADKVKKDR